MRIPVNFVFHVTVRTTLNQRDAEAFARLLRSTFPAVLYGLWMLRILTVMQNLKTYTPYVNRIALRFIYFITTFC